MKLEELKEVARKALGQNKYRQGTGYLKQWSREEDGFLFCSLGAISEESGIPSNLTSERLSGRWLFEFKFERDCKGRACSVPKTFIPLSVADTITHLNDEGSTFEEVLEYIEALTPEEYIEALTPEEYP